MNRHIARSDWNEQHTRKTALPPVPRDLLPSCKLWSLWILSPSVSTLHSIDLHLFLAFRANSFHSPRFLSPSLLLLLSFSPSSCNPYKSSLSIGRFTSTTMARLRFVLLAVMISCVGLAHVHACGVVTLTITSPPTQDQRKRKKYTVQGLMVPSTVPASTEAVRQHRTGRYTNTLQDKKKETESQHSQLTHQVLLFPCLT